jgi:hypothetical protein
MLDNMGFIKQQRGGAGVAEKESCLKCGVKRYVLRVRG